MNRIYRINLKTNETKPITSFGVKLFEMINGKLYYAKDSDGLLYSSGLNGEQEQPVSDYPIASWFDEIGGNVFYTSADKNGDLRLYKSVPSGEDKLALPEALASIQKINNRLLCKIAAGGDYGIKVLSESGELQLAVTDGVTNLFAYDDAIVFVSEEDHLVKRFKLQP